MKKPAVKAEKKCKGRPSILNFYLILDLITSYVPNFVAFNTIPLEIFADNPL